MSVDDLAAVLYAQVDALEALIVEHHATEAEAAAMRDELVAAWLEGILDLMQRTSALEAAARES